MNTSLIMSSCLDNSNSTNEATGYSQITQQDAKAFIEVSELTTTKVTKTRIKIIGKITNTSPNQIDWIAYDLVLLKNGNIAEVNIGSYPCNSTGSYGLMGLESCYFETMNYEASLFDSYRIEISKAEFK